MVSSPVHSRPAFWLEMSRDPHHGGPGWLFGTCLWSPTRKANETRWPFWELLTQVRTGDLVLHLRGQTGNAAFVGYSRAATDGFETSLRPSRPEQWGQARSFYRVNLDDYEEFPAPITSQHVFDRKRAELVDYFERNKTSTGGSRRRLYYVVQSGRLQCLNGAYLSEVDSELAGIILGSEFTGDAELASPGTNVETSEKLGGLSVRVGQRAWSDAIREGYGFRCCIPQCPVTENQFLVASHIARWADAPDLRGSLGNGICLCLMHDKAFELGLFTVSRDLRVAVHITSNAVRSSDWCSRHLLPVDGQPILKATTTPSNEALEHHWRRIGFRPGSRP